MLGLSALSVVNFELSLFEQKFASKFAYEWFLGVESELPNSTFAIPGIINSLAYALTDSWESAIGVNIALVIIVYSVCQQGVPRYAYLALSPAILNFALFALRDPLIYFSFFIFVILVRTLKIWSLAFLTFFLCIINIGLRPENIVILFSFFGLVWFVEAKSAYTRIIILLFGLLAVIYLGTYVPRLLGFSESINIVDLFDVLDQFYYDRATRWDSDSGGSSNILSGRLVDYPLYLRYPIQILSMFILPLPFEISSVTLLLAFIDSCFFIFTFLKFNKHASSREKILFWVYILCFAFFMANYGNALRMRLPAYGIMLGSLYNSNLRNSNKQRKFLSESTSV